MSDQPTALMEPMLPPEGNRKLEDLAMELASKGSALASTLHPKVRQSIGHLVRSMNCYYSNLIEGHDTHPREIDRALAGNYSGDEKQRNLQLEAKAHIEVQELIDAGNMPSIKPSGEFMRWVHGEFCSRLPEDLLWVENPGTSKRLKVVAGDYRSTEVAVGKHIPPLAPNLVRFMNRFEEAYKPENLSKVRQVIAIAASHHRLVWIHPFLAGNGRVARLFSHAWLLDTGIGSSLWSVSRGLARNVDEYKARLMAADSPRRGDLDGRGTLSQEELLNFCYFFLQTAIDQIDFMAKLLDTDNFLTRLRLYINEEIELKKIPKGSFNLLREAWLAGEFKRTRAAEISGYKERAARDILRALLEQGYLVSDTPKGPVRLGFPIDAVERWLPRLYPATS
ncbi:MAG: Fic family protein [Pseudohongiellaceae bacterium]